MTWQTRAASVEAASIAAFRAQRIGMCTACGAVEVVLDHPTGARDLSGIGESARYPTGYGCEVCS